MGGLSRRAFLGRLAVLSAAVGLPLEHLGPQLSRPAAATSAADAPTTVAGTIRRLRSGTRSYRGLTGAAGEAYVPRIDVLQRSPDPDRATRRRSLFYSGHFSDIHLIDAQSPGRLEPMIGENRPVWSGAFRPHDTMTVHVLAAMVAAMADVRVSPLTGAPMSAAFVTGDNADMHSALELQWYITCLDGGSITPNSGKAGVYEGVQAWSEAAYAYHPADPTADPYGLYGFPRIPDLLHAAITTPAVSPGLPVPWYTVYGNHDTTLLGTLRVDDAWRHFALGDRKAVQWQALVESWLSGLGSAESPIQRAVHAMTAGLGYQPGIRTVTRDARRAVFEPVDFMKAHLASPDVPGPVGHGFTQENVRTGQTWWTVDIEPRLRVFGLDTCNTVAGPDGAVPEEQFTWLRAQLAKAQAEQRLVIVTSHHNSATLENRAQPVVGHNQKLYGADEFVAMLQQFPVVVAWLNGHTHINTIVAHPKKGGGGFWEITTASCVDFPQQQQTVELVDNRDGTLSLFATALDHASPATPTLSDLSAKGLASWSREFSANDWAEDPLMRLGSDLDRNVELLLPAPFDVSTISDAQVQSAQMAAKARIAAYEQRGPR